MVNRAFVGYRLYLQNDPERAALRRRAGPGYWIAGVTLLASLTGCAQVNPSAEYQRAREWVRDSTGIDDAFNPDEGGPTEPELQAMLADGLSLDEAVRIALINNRELQAAFYEIGVAKAEWVQSGLLSNPTLGFALLLPEGGGLGNAQLNLAQNIADLWQIPVRRRAAASHLEEAVLRIARIAGERATDVKRAYYRAVAANELANAAVQNLELLSKSHVTVRTQQEAGTASLLDVNLARGEMLRAELALREGRLAAANARRELGKLLSLSTTPDEIRLVDALPLAPPLPAGPDELIALARDKRLDLRSLAQSADAAEQELRLEVAQVFPDVTVGLALEQNERRALPGRDVAADFARASIAAGAPTVPDIQSRGQRRAERSEEIRAKLGPSLSMTVPLFDQNQAQIAKAQYRYDQALKHYEDRYLNIAHDIRINHDRAATAQRNVAFYRDELLPQAQRSLEYATASFQTGKSPILALLEAQRAFVDSRRAYFEVWSSAAMATADLEQTIGAPLSLWTNAAWSTAIQPGGGL